MFPSIVLRFLILPVLLHFERFFLQIVIFGNVHTLDYVSRAHICADVAVLAYVTVYYGVGIHYFYRPVRTVVHTVGTVDAAAVAQIISIVYRCL